MKIMPLKKLLFLLVIVQLVVSFPTALFAQKKEVRVLFIGNSYTNSNNLTHIVSLISDSADTKLITRKSVAGGARLWQHWNGERGLKSKEMIKNGSFDIVVLQDHSMSAIEYPDSTYKYVRLFADYIKGNGAQVFLYNTWARQKVPQYQEIINKVYEKAASESKATLVPVGSSWQLSRQLRPNFNLFVNDGSHPSEEGTFLTACVFVKKILGELPENIATYFRIKDTDGEWATLMVLDKLDVGFCKRVVDEVVED